MTALIGIKRRLILDVAQIMQIPKTFMVSGHRTDFADAHNFVSGNTNWISEPVYVPKLEQGDVQTYMRWIEHFILGHFIKEASEVFDVIHDSNYLALNKFCSELTLFRSNTFSIS